MNPLANLRDRVLDTFENVSAMRDTSVPSISDSTTSNASTLEATPSIDRANLLHTSFTPCDAQYPVVCLGNTPMIKWCPLLMSCISSAGNRTAETYFGRGSSVELATPSSANARTVLDVVSFEFASMGDMHAIKKSIATHAMSGRARRMETHCARARLCGYCYAFVFVFVVRVTSINSFIRCV